jgi:NAD(P)-dependent dehydrogenase (short-subunit alcohol dehydrogenase family)
MTTITAVVTGASGGMGRAITRQLISDGLHVVGLDIDRAGLDDMAALGPQFSATPVDLTKPDAIAEVFAEIADRFGTLHALVNNAGTCFMSEFPNIPPEELALQMDVNFSGAFHCCQAAIPLMLTGEGVKKIVNISSNGAYNFDVFDPPHYRASKAALDTLTKDLARRYATQLIAVNSIAPAMTKTPLFNVLTEEVLEQAIAKMPHNKPMQPEEIAAWVGFLISPAGDVSSGNIIILNQGRDVR